MERDPLQGKGRLLLAGVTILVPFVLLVPVLPAPWQVTGGPAQYHLTPWPDHWASITYNLSGRGLYVDQLGNWCFRWTPSPANCGSGPDDFVLR
jgi:hypothetical protein